MPTGRLSNALNGTLNGLLGLQDLSVSYQGLTGLYLTLSGVRRSRCIIIWTRRFRSLGAIPALLGNLVNLENLRLGFNRFSGANFELKVA